MAATRRDRSPSLGLLTWPERPDVSRALHTVTVGGLARLAAGPFCGRTPDHHRLCSHSPLAELSV